MSVLERRLEILKIMTVKRKSNVSKLAEKMGVSKRTIQRDIQALIAVAPLVCVSGNGGGIEMLETYHPYRNIFTKEEVEKMSLKEKMDATRKYREGEYEKLIDAVYPKRGWNLNGVPTIAHLKELGMDLPELLEVVEPLQ